MSIVDAAGSPVTAPHPVPASAVEMPPNKAIAAGASSVTGGGIASVVVGLLLHYFAPNTPPEIAAMWNTLATSILGVATGFLVYYMPHGAMVKEPTP